MEKKKLNKKAVFFSIDVLIAMIIILLSILIVYPIIKDVRQESSLSEDVIDVLSSLKIGDIDNNYVRGLINEEGLTDLEKPILEQIGEFYIDSEKIVIAKNLAKQILNYLDAEENIGIWYGNTLLACSKYDTQTDCENDFDLSKNIEISRRVISGIQEGESVTAFSARSFFSSDLRTEYFYFGGYIGEGDISIRIEYDGDIESIDVELVTSSEFDLKLNGIDSGHYGASPDEFTPVKYDLSAYIPNFKSGENILKFVGTGEEEFRITGGYIRVNYKNSESYFERPSRHYLPGIEGLMNIYDSIYVPEGLTDMEISLHLKSPYEFFLKIGDKEIYRDVDGSGYGYGDYGDENYDSEGELGDEETIIIDNSFLLEKGLDYSILAGKTIPLRLGLEDVSYTGLDVDIDSILVTDVSGSMEWCNNIGETSFDETLWVDGDNVFCAERRHLTSSCYSKIESTKYAEKAFVSAMLNNNGPRVGIVEYSKGKDVKKVQSDLTSKLYIGPDPDCYEKDVNGNGWYEEDFDDSSWGSYTTGTHEFYICDRCKAYFRKTFTINNLNEINSLELYTYFSDFGFCLINEKEVDSIDGSKIFIPTSVLRQGENIITCAVGDNGGGFRFDAGLYSNKGTLVPKYSIWRRTIIPKLNCGSGSPKYTRARTNVETNYRFLATIQNNGASISDYFNVGFYRGATRLGGTTINGLEAGGVTSIKLEPDWVATLSSDTTITVKADENNVVSESSDTNNDASINIDVKDYVDKDLEVYDVYESPYYVCEYGVYNIELYARIRNTGSEDITDSFDVSFFKGTYPNGIFLEKVTINGINAGEYIYSPRIYVDMDISETTPIYAYVDYDNTISDEYNENNNIKQESITMRNPDLEIYSVSSEIACSTGTQNFYLDVTAYSRYCAVEDPFELCASFIQNDYSNCITINGLGAGAYQTKSFTLSKNIPLLGTTYPIYAYIDPFNSIIENDENDNSRTGSLYAGPDIHLSSGTGLVISSEPLEPVKGESATFDLHTRVKNDRCFPVTFKIAYFVNDYNNPNNIIHEEEISPSSTYQYFDYEWTPDPPLEEDVTVYAFADYDNAINYETDEADNIRSNTIHLKDPEVVEASILPIALFPSLKEINPLFFDVLGFSTSCSGDDYTLFDSSGSLNEHIARTKDLTNYEEGLTNFIENTETWWDTCICCGINKARAMLASSESSNKFLVVMSDGEANVRCLDNPATEDMNNDGEIDSKDDAIKAACDAYNEEITVYSVGFGSQTEVDETTLEAIATRCGDGKYYYSAIDDLIKLYEDLAQEIIELSYSEQTIESGGEYTPTILYPDSYIEFTYEKPEPPFGLIITAQNQFSDAFSGSFNIPGESEILEAEVVSYSGSRWTNEVKINDNIIFNLNDYGSDYTELGDPSVINLPIEFINIGLEESNLVELITGLGPSERLEGSSSDKIIYTIKKDMIAYSPLSRNAEGCIWTLQFEDDTFLELDIPEDYSDKCGEICKTCEYTEASHNMPEEGVDAINSAVYNLLKKLDFEVGGNGKINVKFREQSFDISYSEITGIPYDWSTVAQVRRWY